MWSSGEWIQFDWKAVDRQDGMEEESITAKELIPIVLACVGWGSRWVGQVVRVNCDNTGAVSVVNSGYSVAPQIMHLLRCLLFIRAHFQLEVWACHISGAQNILRMLFLVMTGRCSFHRLQGPCTARLPSRKH